MPNLGVVKAGDTTFTVADVPGLIEGASEGRGLGHDFLRHIERCAAIVHVIDLATMEPGRNPVGDLEVIEQELQRYGGLEDRPRLVALNKVDVPDGRDMADIVAEDIAERGWPVFPVSAASHEGLRELMFAMAGIVAARRARGAAGGDDAHRHPPDVGPRRHGVHGHRDRRGLAGARREARALDPADRLQQRRGRRLPRRPAQPARRGGAGCVELGAVEGDPVLIGDPDNAVVFDFKPGIDAGRPDARSPRRGPALQPVAHRPRSGAARSTRPMPDRAEGETRADVARRYDEEHGLTHIDLPPTS